MENAGHLDRVGRALIGVLVYATGFAALINQITWQRVIALHAGVDLSSATTVVVAFLLGLGIGSLVGGRIADRVDWRGALTVLGGSAILIAAFGVLSIWLLDDVYRDVAVGLDSLPLRVGFNVAVLLVPTTLMGVSMPLVARAVVTSSDRAATQIGWYAAINTLGAATGAVVGGWVLLGSRGFEGSIRFAAIVAFTAGAFFIGLARSTTRVYSKFGVLLGPIAAALIAAGLASSSFQVIAGIQPTEQYAALGAGVVAVIVFGAGIVAFAWNNAGRSQDEDASPARSETGVIEPLDVETPPGPPLVRSRRAIGPPGIWYLAYALTGAVALGFEQVFFRLIDGVMRSNSYTFAHVLSMYLALLAVGNAAGAWLRGRVRDDRSAFLWIQFAVGMSAVSAVVVFARLMPVAGPLGDRFAEWFNTAGFAGGFGEVTTTDRAVFGFALPLWLMGVPVVLMGAAFPFVQGLVTRDVRTVGGRTGQLVFANLAGNVVGASITSFVLVEHLGTAGAYQVLLLPLAGAGVVAASLAVTRRLPRVAAVVAAIVAAMLLLPSNDQLWAVLHGTDADQILVAEDRSCASAVEVYGPEDYQLTINGASQNSYPYDDFHVLIGLVPALAHPDPDHALAVGLGIGSTSYAMLAAERVGRVTTVELCGGNYELVDELARQSVDAFERLRSDPRHEALVGDGRRHLLVVDDRYDLVVPDTYRPTSAGAGNLYSREFQRLVHDRLTDDGVTAGWVSSFRALNSVTTTFPYVVSLTVPSYNDSVFYLASRSPIELDADTLLDRFDRLPADAFPSYQRASLRRYLASIDPECVNDGEIAPPPAPDLLNVDLWPRDEYFLTNGGIGEEQVARTSAAIDDQDNG